MSQAQQNKILKKWLLSTLLLFLSYAGIAGSLFEEANTCYKNKQYNQAVNKYLELAQSGQKNAAVYYNLGNSFYQLKEYPKAVLYYERALKADPGNDKIEHNLKLAYDKSLTKIEDSHEFFVVKFIHHFIRGHSARTWTIIFLITWWVSVIAFLIFFSRKPGTASFYLRTGVYLLLVSALLFYVAKVRYREQTTSWQAIIMQPNTELKTEPVAAARTRLLIEAGNKVELIDKDSNWYKVLLPNGKEGWVNEKTMRKI